MTIFPEPDDLDFWEDPRGEPEDVWMLRQVSIAA